MNELKHQTVFSNFIAPGALVVLLVLSGCSGRSQPKGTPSYSVPDQGPVSSPVLPAPLPVPNPLTVSVVPEIPAPALDLPLPVTELDKKYSFHAVGIPIDDALRLFARDSNLNMVLDQDLEGELTVDFEQVGLESAMDAILESHDYSWQRKGDLIRVYRQTTRTFDVDYLRLQRQSTGTSQSGSFGLADSSEGGGQGASTYQVEQTHVVDFWTELENQLLDIVGPEGRVVANRTAGFVTITGGRRGIEEVERYLNKVHLGSQRQVAIEAKIVQVELSDDFSLGIDWSAPNLAEVGGYSLGSVIGFAADAAGGTNVIPDRNLVNALGTELAATQGLVLGKDGSTRAFLEALRTQGDLNVVSQPKVTTMNNQTAQIRVATELPFFVQTKGFVPAAGTDPAQPAEFEQRSATLGLILQVTPQISGDGWISMEITPVLTRSTGVVFNPEFVGESGPPIIDVKQTSVVARVRTGETIVIGGLIEDEETEDVRKIPLLGDLPGVGGLFRSTGTTNRKVELVILITPVADLMAPRDQQIDW